VWWPLPLPYAWLLHDVLRYILGGVLTVAGLSLIAAAEYLFYRAREEPTPSSPSDQLFVEGAYRISRNPMYTGAAMIRVGIAFLLNSSWFLARAVAMLVIVKYLVILPEEAYLEHRLGDEYRQYKQSVRRWL
jgi:protein-S-isoprenylcysteine O-methyltransferase Ste14